MYLGVRNGTNKVLQKEPVLEKLEWNRHLLPPNTTTIDKILSGLDFFSHLVFKPKDYRNTDTATPKKPVG